MNLMKRGKRVVFLLNSIKPIFVLRCLAVANPPGAQTDRLWPVKRS